MKLKTLNEIGNQNDEIFWAIKNVIKQEVINWVKDCKICPTSRPIKICSRHEVLCLFNNIIEEDLK